MLLGGDGDELLLGNSGRDLLVGGIGADRIVGNADDDILIAGFTDHDNNDAALCSIMDEWTSARSYSARVQNLLDGTGSLDRKNGTYFLNDQTVHDDAVQDILTGSDGQDWFLFNKDGDGGMKDKVTDLTASEFASDIDFINALVTRTFRTPTRSVSEGSETLRRGGFAKNHATNMTFRSGQ